MELDKNTILVSSYPKSGATWFQFLVYSCYNGGFTSSREILRFYPPQNRTKLIEKSQNSPLFIKSHTAYTTELPYLNKNSKCILLVRHPLDVAFSLINHHKNQGSLRLLLPIFRKKYLSQFLEKNAAKNESSWSYHLASWQKQKEFPLHIIKYEDLINDPVLTLIKLRDNYDLKFSDDNIVAAVNYCSIEKMKTLENKEVTEKIAGLFYSKRRKLTNRFLNSSFVNKGGSAEYETKLSASQLKKAAKVFNPSLKELDLKELL